MTLQNRTVILGLHASLFILMQTVQKGFQLKSEDETLIIKKNSTEILVDKKMAKKAGRGFLLATRFCKSTN